MSHGPVDIVAARAGEVLLVQVKSGSARADSEEIDLLKLWAKAFNAKAEVWLFKKRGIIQRVAVAKRKRVASIVRAIAAPHAATSSHPEPRTDRVPTVSVAIRLPSSGDTSSRQAPSSG